LEQKTPKEGRATRPVVRALYRAQELGFLGPETLDVQIAHSLDLASCAMEAMSHLPSQAPGADQAERLFLDLGSGGGLPGLVLAEAWPEWMGVLLDSNRRKTVFLNGAVTSCGWRQRISVVGSRAEVAGRDVGMRGRFDLVVARAFAAPPVTAECAAPFLKLGGVLVVAEPPPSHPAADVEGSVDIDVASASGEPPCPQGAVSLDRSDPKRWPVEPLAKLGLVPLGLWRRTFGFEILCQEHLCPEDYPRREGIPAKRPLY
jgi:16S rRNA (guanine527-N7)-methyltransferase